ncbi:MAG: citrate synthase [Gemmatimonadaceae bacterium]|nr:citrate synthase [Gemmatimonadaceae bacterium]
MPETANLQLGEKKFDLPVVVGSENEHAIDISKLRDQTGYITLDEGYGNTGSCQSSITFIDGDRGILRYRGVPIEDLAEQSSFIETAHLLIWGQLPSSEQLDSFSRHLTHHQFLREQLRQHFEVFPPGSPPMAVLSAVLNSLACFYPELLDTEDEELFEEAAARLISKVRTIAAYSYKHDMGHYLVYPHPEKDFCENFLHMMFSEPYRDYEPDPALVRALDVLLLLHADHEQNCSTSTVRMVGSSGANLFASVAAGVSALWGRLHGGANVAVVSMLESILEQGISVKDYVQQVKDKEAGIRLMGFGHRVYRNFDPRAKIIKKQAEAVLAKIQRDDPLLGLAEELEGAALADDYFKERSLYPNVDFYSGVILRALGIPTSMFTVMFAMGRMPGWIAQWYEDRFVTRGRIHRPRQVYTGPTEVCYVPLSHR